MRISIDHGRRLDGGLVIGGIDPPPPVDVNELFRLTQFEAAKTTIAPFENVAVSWSIEPVDGTDPDDYAFDLVSPNGVVHALDIPLQGAYSHEGHKTMLLMIAVRRRGRERLGLLDPTLQVQVDESDCLVRTIPAFLVDALVDAEVDALTGATPELRLRSGRSVESTWNFFRIGYDLPLEVVIDGFFNADLDVDLEFRFQVTHNGERTDLDVTVGHDTDVDFSTLEDILSLGSGPVIAATAERILPLVLACEARQIEAQVARHLLDFIEPDLDDHRLLAVRVYPDDHAGGPRLELILCPFPLRTDGIDLIDSSVVATRAGGNGG